MFHSILDEVQRVPGIFSALQVRVDEDATPGQYILTGSQNFLLMASITQSLAGRTGILHLMPFTLAELTYQAAVDLSDPENLFNRADPGLDWRDLLLSGFFPRIHDRNIPSDLWLSDYIQTYLQRDVRSLIQIGDLDRFERFLKLLAGRVGQLLNYNSLANDCGISPNTAKNWISILVTSFSVFLLKPHHRNFNKRLIKTPKLYFTDCGLAARLLGLRNVEHLETHPLRGALFENLVVAELYKTYQHARRDPPLCFWRDQTGREVDIVTEEADRLYPLEIKSARSVKTDACEALREWCALSGTPPERATVIYGGTEAYSIHKVKIRPWFSI